MLSTHLALRHIEKTDEGCDQQRQRVNTVELRHFPIEKREAHKDKEQVRAKDFNRGASQGDKRLACDDPPDGTAQAVEHTDKRHDVQHAQRPELPFIYQQTKVFLREPHPPPGVAHANEEQAYGAGNPGHPVGE